MNEINNNTNMESEENLNDNFCSDLDFYNSDNNLNIAGMEPVEENTEQILAGNDSSSDGGRIVIDDIGSGEIRNQSEPVTEDTDISDGNAAYMEGNPPVKTDVSCNDLYLSAAPVSAGDIYNTYYYSCSCGDGSEIPFAKEDITHISGTLDALLLTASALLFFILFAWAEKKISNGIRKMFHRMKAD